MTGVPYYIFGLVAIIIHCTIYKETIFYFKKEKADRMTLVHHKYIMSVLFYFITDFLWGILEALHLTQILYVDTVIYYMMMSFAVVLWSEYVVRYLELDNFFGKILPLAGRTFLLLEVIALIVNLFHPFFFWFDKNGMYHAGIIRYVLLYVQIVLFAVTSLQASLVAVFSEGKKRRRNYTIFLLGCAMILAILAQIQFPLLPIYSIGYMIGCCVLYVFIEDDEKEERYQTLKHNMDIISFMAQIYYCSYYIDMHTGEYYELDNQVIQNEGFIGQVGVAQETLDKICEFLVLPQYKKEMQEFTNMKTLDERLKGKHHIGCQFESVNRGWSAGYFISGERDENGKLKQVIWAIRSIHDEKEKEAKLLYNSYMDELTGIFNRKMFAEDVEENLKTLNDEDFVYISMDVNGLKGINDTLGHAAGDELIRGAAQCMKECMKDYGRVYRTGGDEFIALLNISQEGLEQLKKKFEEKTAHYGGNFIDRISVSCGYVERREVADLTMFEIEKLADKRMYEAKHQHYRTNGVDRRSQQNAFKCLCELYTKILKINLTLDEYSVISMNTEEQTEDKGFAEGIFQWLSAFANTGQVHPEDCANYLEKTSKEYMQEYFRQGNKCLNVVYRRKIDDEFKQVAMDIVPSEDYKEDNQSMYLYVKAVER